MRTWVFVPAFTLLYRAKVLLVPYCTVYPVA
jgi:hypothetical protein